MRSTLSEKKSERKSNEQKFKKWIKCYYQFEKTVIACLKNLTLLITVTGTVKNGHNKKLLFSERKGS